MTKNELFELYKKVQQKDRNAEQLLVEEHRKLYPDSVMRNEDTPGSSSRYRENLHIMYLHLT